MIDIKQGTIEEYILDIIIELYMYDFEDIGSNCFVFCIRPIDISNKINDDYDSVYFAIRRLEKKGYFKSVHRGKYLPTIKFRRVFDIEKDKKERQQKLKL